MSLKMVAVVTESGWAFIEQEEQIYLLRPPYKQKIEASEKDIEKAISTYGFKSNDLSFETIHAAISFLNKEYVRLQQEQGIQPPSSEELGEILEMMGKETWEEFLEMAQNHLIPQGDFKTAEQIAQDLLKSEQVWAHAEIMKSAKSILDQCQQHQQRLEDLETEVIHHSQQEKFPHAYSKFQGSEVLRCPPWQQLVA